MRQHIKIHLVNRSNRPVNRSNRLVYRSKPVTACNFDRTGQRLLTLGATMAAARGDEGEKKAADAEDSSASTPPRCRRSCPRPNPHRRRRQRRRRGLVRPTKPREVEERVIFQRRIFWDSEIPSKHEPWPWASPNPPASSVKRCTGNEQVIVNINSIHSISVTSATPQHVGRFSWINRIV